MIVKEELHKLGIHYKSVELGEVEISENLSNVTTQMFEAGLKESGLELVRNKENLVVERIKAAVKQLVNFPDELKRPSFPKYISEKVNFNYGALSKIFSEAEGISMEKYLIGQRIKRVKELLLNKCLSINDIAYTLLYSSVAHLTNQFKKITGLTPFQYRQLREKRCKKSDIV